ncbi:aromatic hydrocarbon degradation protein [Flavobacterium sp. N1719]|uniref:aromatic hydrocarbon degradation protein n=1 Tax=Flavobacterium sp. N1719 TaxID=2885633 RepID=UPI0022216BBD|nr:aromatic hydrocarbon degradation protein [Flavobacterium sp. N1719]
MKRLYIIGVYLSVQSIWAQSVSSSSYSQFGLGSFYETDFGSIPSTAGSGIALSSKNFINNLNPASLSEMSRNDFFFELGGNAYQTIAKDFQSKSKRNNVQFSHVSLGFPLGKKSGFSLALMPYTNTRFQINKYEMDIGNSDESYLYYYNNTGGISKMEVSFGKRQTDKWSWGVTCSILFGNIETNDIYQISNSVSTFSTSGNYHGFQFKLGSQWRINQKLTIGNTIQFPTQMKAAKYRSISSTDSSETTEILTNENENVARFYFPLSTGTGLQYEVKKDWNFTLDYSRSFWGYSSNNSSYGQFKAQDIVAMGLTYQKTEPNRNSWHLTYSAGLKYDSGYLLVNNQPIRNYALSMGLGIPLERTKTKLNITYSYGIKGTVENNLIRENYHKIGINLSYNAFWFAKRKYD